MFDFVDRPLYKMRTVIHCVNSQSVLESKQSPLGFIVADDASTISEIQSIQRNKDTMKMIIIVDLLECNLPGRWVIICGDLLKSFTVPALAMLEVTSFSKIPCIDQRLKDIHASIA